VVVGCGVGSTSDTSCILAAGQTRAPNKADRPVHITHNFQPSTFKILLLVSPPSFHAVIVHSIVSASVSPQNPPATSKPTAINAPTVQSMKFPSKTWWWPWCLPSFAASFFLFHPAYSPELSSSCRVCLARRRVDTGSDSVPADSGSYRGV
jgi:hypothetical protein